MVDAAPPVLSDPVALATHCAALVRPWLIGVDVDGTLAPIVTRPELAQLAPGALDALGRLSESAGVMVAVVSGRPLTDLRHRFAIPPTVMLLGSHGAEVGTEVDRRTVDEQLLIDSTIATLEQATSALPGSWIEHKPLAVALHVRQAGDAAGEATLARLGTEFAATGRLTLHRGHKVLEIAIRSTSKMIAFGGLRDRLDPTTTFFIGDDQSDERVFSSLRPRDVSIKVGGEPTNATHRLDSPTEVVSFLKELAERHDAPQVNTNEP